MDLFALLFIILSEAVKKVHANFAPSANEMSPEIGTSFTQKARSRNT